MESIIFTKEINYGDKGIPKRGKVAERGCIGCGWYDIEEWRNKLSKTLRSNS